MEEFREERRVQLLRHTLILLGNILKEEIGKKMGSRKPRLENFAQIMKDMG